jgi:2',3'-cyclic-nucleotide 2'-phosphodiesterase (5'-nucleotidase family)
MTRVGSPLLCVTFVLVGGCTYRQADIALEGQDVALTVMHTSDTHSRYFPYFFAPGQIDQGLGLIPKRDGLAVVGGISRVGTIVKCARGLLSNDVCRSVQHLTGPPATRSMHLDSGDIFQGAPVYNLFNGEVEVRAMTNLGLTAMVVGNHEFDKGSSVLVQQLQRFAGFPMLAANYQFGDPLDYTQPKLANLIPPFIISNVNGLKVGIIGMANLSSIQSIIEGGNSTGARAIEDKDAIAAAARVLRPQVDILVVTSHLGLEEDEDVAVDDASDRDENDRIAIEGIDVIFGGHLHIVLNPPKDLPHFDETTGEPRGHTVLCHSGAFAKYVGRLDLVVHVPSAEEKAAGMRGHVKSYTYRVIPITDDIPEDPELVRLLEPYQFKMNQVLNLAQAFALIPCERGSSTCPKVLRNAADGGDSQLGNLVATSMRLRKRVEADFGLTNSLGIRADFESGGLDFEQMYNVFPFENTITTMILSGGEVQETLDFVAARSSERGCRSQIQVSGIYFDMVCHREDPECNARLGRPAPCAKNIHFGDNCRNPDGTLDSTRCKPLQPFQPYSAAVNDYIAAGGSGFAVLKRNTSKFNTGISLRDALVDFIRTQPDRCDPNRYRNVAGVFCRDEQGTRYDCSTECCCHDEESGPVLCSTRCPAFQNCRSATPPRSPEPYDFTNVACLAPGGVEAPDGRIRPITGSGM